MARHIFTVLCRSALIDRFSNSLSLIEVIDELTVELQEKDAIASLSIGKPIVIPIQAVFVSTWVRDDDDTSEEPASRIVLFTPDGRMFPMSEQRINLKTTRATRSLGHVAQLAISGSGVYRFDVQTKADDWKTVAEYRMLVTVAASGTPVAP